MMEAESLDSVFLDLESEALLRSKVTELKCRLEQRPGSSSTTSSTSEGSLRTRAVRLLSSLSDEVSHRIKFTLYLSYIKAFFEYLMYSTSFYFFVKQFIFFYNLLYFSLQDL